VRQCDKAIELYQVAVDVGKMTTGKEMAIAFYNQGWAYRQRSKIQGGKNWTDAISAYNNYLLADPTAPDRVEVERAIRTMGGTPVTP
jgi:hypothetical protein